jgi:hypothetical protein
MTATAARFRASCFTAFLVLAAAPALAAQDRPTLGPDDYGRWEQLGGAQLSPDGRWLAASVGRVNDEDELRIHRTDGDSVVVAPYGSGQTFSSDGRWLVYRIGTSEEERAAARRADRPVRDDAAIFDLEAGTIDVREGIQSFSLSADGRFVALRRYKPEDKESQGADLIVEELATGTRMVFGNVSDAVWADEGHLLAMTVDADDRVGNGISLYDPASGSLRPLDQAEATYRQMRWREDAADLAVLRTVEDEAFRDTTHVALVWRGLDRPSATSYTLDGSTHAQLARTTRIAEHRAPSWSDDGSVVFLGVQERIPAPEPCEEPTDHTADGGTEAAECDEDDEDEDKAGVEIWHTRDVDPVPQQRVRERQLREANHISAWHLDRNAFVQLGDETVARTSLVPGGRHVIGMVESRTKSTRCSGSSSSTSTRSTSAPERGRSSRTGCPRTPSAVPAAVTSSGSKASTGTPTTSSRERSAT